MQQHTGVIKKWKNAQGFGFIQTDHGQSIFFHISEFQPERDPQLHESVVFQMGKDAKGRTQAINVTTHVQQKSANVQKPSHTKAKKQRKNRHKKPTKQDKFASVQKTKLAFVVSLYALLLTATLFKFVPWEVLGWYVLMGVLTFGMYFKDKVSAQTRQWRTPEKTLHTLSVLGGWAGALLAQSYLRHKSKKTSFQVVYYLTIVLNILGLASYLYSL